MFVQPPNSPAALESPVLRLRTATDSDAADAFHLATEVFGARQFLYTVYQAPQSIKHMERLISARDPQHPIIVIRRGTSLVGYYEALLRQEEGFLNYIATDPRHEGQGIGRALFTHFEESAREAGCSHLALDVFQSNARACAWYLRLGFHQEKLVRIGRINLQNVPYDGDEILRVDPGQLEKALSEEAVWGFGRIDCTCSKGGVALGLIGGRICKLLGYNGLDLEEAMAAIAGRFHGQRESVIVSFAEAPSTPWEPSSCEAVIRLRKRLN